MKTSLIAAFVVWGHAGFALMAALFMDMLPSRPLGGLLIFAWVAGLLALLHVTTAHLRRLRLERQPGDVRYFDRPDPDPI